MSRERFKTGTVVFDKPRGTWRFLWWVDGKRKSKTIGTKRELPTKTAAWKAAIALRDKTEAQPVVTNVPTVSAIVTNYKTEKMPKRYSTRRSYDVWLRLYVLPVWGNRPITDVQARPIELWLRTLELAPRSLTGLRGMLRILWEHAMWRGDIPTQRNPMELVAIENASKRQKQPRSLTVEQFRNLLQHLREPFHTMALVCVCFGLRISECLALKWSDVDWLDGRLLVQRSAVRQRVDDTKTIYSNRPLAIGAEMLEVLKAWKQTTQFPADTDWIFASPVQLGRLPWSADSLNDAYRKAGKESGVGHVSTHTMRHTYRSWLDAVKTPIAVQQKLMRHADIRTTMNVYGDVVTDEMAIAHSKVVGLALNGSRTDRKAS